MILECEELLLLKSPQNKVKLSLAITEKKKKKQVRHIIYPGSILK